MRVLDVACGTGIVARLAAPRVAPSGSVTGIDLNAGMIAVARAHAAEEEVLIDFRRGDVAELPFGDAAFDLVCYQQGLQFFPNKARALEEMRRVLVPGGLLALSVFGAPSRYSAALAAGLAKYADPDAAERSLAPFALGNREALRMLVHAGGFESIEIHTIAVIWRVQPSQEWLMQDSAGTPFGEAIAEMDAVARAAMVREIAAQLKDLWDAESFAVPTEVHLVYARR
jgi:ubiquinone/menaquinone biosynthesis C-methylase UbiE